MTTTTAVQAHRIGLERAEFLSTLASPGAQAAMLAYIARTDEMADLPLYDPNTYRQTVRAGRFERPSPKA